MSMTEIQFGFQMDRLKSVYGDAKYPQERVRSIHAWAKRFDQDVFKLIVDRLIDENANAPLLPKFKEAYSIIKQSLPASKTTVNCLFCGGSGWYSPMSLGAASAWACDCAAGAQIPANFARWQGPKERMFPRPHEIMRSQPDQGASAPNEMRHLVGLAFDKGVGGA